MTIDGSVGRSTPRAMPAAIERAHAALVAIALGDDRRAQRGGSASISRCAADPSTSSTRQRTCATASARSRAGERAAGALRRGERGEHPIERAILAEEEHLVLAAEVVVQVAGREIRGDGDVAHPGGGEAARAEHARRRAQDGDAAGVRRAVERRFEE